MIAYETMRQQGTKERSAIITDGYKGIPCQSRRYIAPFNGRQAPHRASGIDKLYEVHLFGSKYSL